ncbi:MAG TPA: tetratricopeptide repeat protein, partial [Candidatus Methylacidiphilales bacterium]
LTFDRGNVQAMILLGDLYRYRASREEGIEDRVADGQKALTAYQNALKHNPLDDTIQGRMGMTFDVMRRYSEAFFCYTAAVKAQPHNGQFWNALGNHFWQRGMLTKAEQAYLLAAQCPHGFEGSADAAKELRQLLDAKGIPAPKPGENPLDVPPEAPEPPTTP